ncbi:MAG: hypothetical protein J7559_19540, partial [Cohnella sp.]|nr:hypothetical protein [Cohnella sp.]
MRMKLVNRQGGRFLFVGLMMVALVACSDRGANEHSSNPVRESPLNTAKASPSGARNEAAEIDWQSRIADNRGAGKIKYVT